MDFYYLQAIFEQRILFQQSFCVFFFLPGSINIFISTAAFETVAIGGKSEIIWFSANMLVITRNEALAAAVSKDTPIPASWCVEVPLGATVLVAYD